MFECLSAHAFTRRNFYRIRKQSFWHLLHHWNRQFISNSPTLRHHKRLHNAQFINHTARTKAEHKYFSRLWGFSVSRTNNMFNMFSVYVFPPLVFHPPTTIFLSHPHNTMMPAICSHFCVRFVGLLFSLSFFSGLGRGGSLLKAVFITRRILDGIEGNIGLEML